MSNLVKHAMGEYNAAGWTNEDGTFKDEMQELMCDQVLDLLKLFSEHGHSGSSAPYAIDLFCKLAKFEPIVPLTGDDCEWAEVDEGLQNKRCSSVFKRENRFGGQAYNINSVVFWEWSECDLLPEEKGYPAKDRYKSYFTSCDSAKPIEFPYIPTTEYVEVGK